MTKAYKVVTGYAKDIYGYTTNTEIAKFFFNKEDAEKLYKEGEYTREETAIYTTFKDGTISKATTGANFYERRKKEAKENERVELEKVVENKYKMEEIEIN